MLAKLFLITNMMELTTGVVFLMSSLYGSGQTNVHVDNIINSQDQTAAVSAAVISLSPAQKVVAQRMAIEAYLRQEFADEPLLIDIARCESNFRQFDDKGDVIRGIVNKADVGIFQINERYHDETAKKLNLDLHTIEGNVAYGKHLYEEQGSKPWSASAKCWSAGNTVSKSN